MAREAKLIIVASDKAKAGIDDAIKSMEGMGLKVRKVADDTNKSIIDMAKESKRQLEGINAALQLGGWLLMAQQVGRALADITKEARENSAAFKDAGTSFNSLKNEVGQGIVTAIDPMVKGIGKIADEWARSLKAMREYKEALSSGDLEKASLIGQRNMLTGKISSQSVEKQNVIRLGYDPVQSGDSKKLADLADSMRYVMQGIAYYSKPVLTPAKSGGGGGGSESPPGAPAHALAPYDSFAANYAAMADAFTLSGASGPPDSFAANYAAMGKAFADALAERGGGPILNKANSGGPTFITDFGADIEPVKAELGGIGLVINDVVLPAMEAMRSLGGQFKDGWTSALEEIAAKWTGWAGMLKDAVGTVVAGLKTALQSLGESLVKQNDAWGNLGRIAVDVLSQVLAGIGAQLAGLAAVHALSGDFVGAALAAAGSASAFIASGAAGAWADSMPGGSSSKTKATPSGYSGGKASYTGAQSITFNFYNQGNVVGKGGLQELADLIEGLIKQRARYA